MLLVWIISATILVSTISLIGVFTLGVKTKTFDNILVVLVGFAAGGLMGSAFLHLLPQAAKQSGGADIFLYAMIGFTVFFLMERYLHWRHCHDGVCEVHTFTYMNLLGDGFHNFIDGLIIAASFTADLRLGVVTTLAVIFHEIPQEIGDFGVLVYGGFSKAKALLFNFTCGLMSVFGAILGYIFSGKIENASLFLIAFTAGGFIYIAASDLIPELHRDKNIKRANVAFFAFVIGIAFMAVLKMVE